MAIKDFFPSIRPAFDCNFSSTRAVDPRFVFTRTTTGSVASYFDKNSVLRFAPSNTPRIDFDPLTGECLGLMCESQRTNLFLYSEEVNNIAWTKARTTVTVNATTSPANTDAADKIVEDTALSTHYVSQSYSVTSGTTYSLSFFAKRAECQWFSVANVGGFNTFSCDFDLVQGVVTRPVNLVDYRIKNIGNDWFYCSVTAEATVTEVAQFRIFLSRDGINLSYAGDGASGAYLYGVQLEAGQSASSYIQTTSAQVTRTGDILSLTGLNASSWYKQDEGTFLIEFTPYTELQSTVRMLIGSDICYIAYFLQNSNRLRTYDGVNITIANNGAVAGKKQKAIVSYSDSSVVVTTDGAATVTGLFDGSYGSEIYIGCLSGGTQLNGWIRRIAYYPKSFQNAQLLALTN